MINVGERAARDGRLRPTTINRSYGEGPVRIAPFGRLRSRKVTDKIVP